MQTGKASLSLSFICLYLGVVETLTEAVDTMEDKEADSKVRDFTFLLVA